MDNCGLQVASTNWRRATAYINAEKSEDDIKEWLALVDKDEELTPGRYIQSLAMIANPTRFVSILAA